MLILAIIGIAVALAATLTAVAFWRRAHAAEAEALRHQAAFAEAKQSLATTAKMSALGEMVGGIAHEINNPLATIKTIVDQLEEMASEGDLNKEDLRELLIQVSKTTDRVSRIVTGLKSFCRDSSQDPFLKVSVARLLDDTVSLCEERFAKSGVKLTTASISSALELDGRETEISQVLLNLLNNAHDAIAGQAERWVSLQVLEDEQSVTFVITDSGKGIPAEVAEKMFRPFFTTKEIGKGTGLGLSISMGIIQRHNGTLQLDRSCPNTRFLVTLPKRQGPKLRLVA